MRSLFSVLLLTFTTLSEAAHTELDQNIIAKLEELQNDVKGQTKLILSLQEEVASQRNRIAELEGLNVKLQNQKGHPFSHPDSSVTENNGVVPEDRSKEHNGNLSQGILENVQNYGLPEGNIRPSRLLTNSEGPVAFQAHLTTDIKHIGLHQKIMFNFVSLNIGNAYHSAHGLFIAPRPGIYIFSGSILSHISKDVQMTFMKNGVGIGGGILANSGPNLGYDQGSATVVAQLNAGDEVWIEHQYPDDSSVRASPYTCFMGCLIMDF